MDPFDFTVPVSRGLAIPNANPTMGLSSLLSLFLCPPEPAHHPHLANKEHLRTSGFGQHVQQTPKGYDKQPKCRRRMCAELNQRLSPRWIAFLELCQKWSKGQTRSHMTSGKSTQTTILMVRLFEIVRFTSKTDLLILRTSRSFLCPATSRHSPVS